MKWFLAALALFICASPIDIWPDLLPFGSLDDVAIAIAAVQAFQKATKDRLAGSSFRAGDVIDAEFVKAA